MPAPRTMMAKDAPKAAPCAMPKVDAEANGFFSRHCIAQPTVAKPIPASMAVRILGKRWLKTIIDACLLPRPNRVDRKSTRLNSSHVKISYAVFHPHLLSFPTRRSSDLGRTESCPLRNAQSRCGSQRVFQQALHRAAYRGQTNSRQHGSEDPGQAVVKNDNRCLFAAAA